MQKLLLVFFIGIITLSFISCENDDICIEPTTPQLIIRFYDFSNPTKKKKVTLLSVWVVGNDSIIKKKETDSIAIPLKNTADITTYKLSSSNLVDEITFTYQRNAIFVSRSCGYKYIYQNFNALTPTSNWVKRLIIITPTVENEKNAHIKILH